MKTMILATVITAAAAGAAFAQEAPHTVMKGQVKHPGQMEWNAPAEPSYRDVYYGEASAVIPGGYYMADPGHVEAPGDYAEPYDRKGQGKYVFDGENVNNDRDYSGK